MGRSRRWSGGESLFPCFRHSCGTWSDVLTDWKGSMVALGLTSAGCTSRRSLPTASLPSSVRSHSSRLFKVLTALVDLFATGSPNSRSHHSHRLVQAQPLSTPILPSTHLIRLSSTSVLFTSWMLDPSLHLAFAVCKRVSPVCSPSSLPTISHVTPSLAHMPLSACARSTSAGIRAVDFPTASPKRLSVSRGLTARGTILTSPPPSLLLL